MAKAKKTDPITWTLRELKASDLKPNPNNPKTISRKGISRLAKSLSKFGKVYDGIANADLSVIDGHSRLTLNQDELVRYFVPSRQLSEAEYKEFNAVFDIAKAGETDMQIIEETFTDEFFEDWELDKKLNELKGDKDAKYPIVAEFDEKYSAVIIVCSTDIEISFIRNLLELAKEKSYKNKTVGETNVITGKTFIDICKSKLKL